MKCKKHPFELGAGVCATCLRERLLALIAARDGISPDHRRNFTPDPSPCHLRRFFSTPQVGPTTTTTATASNMLRHNQCQQKFSLFFTLFGYSKPDEIRSSRPSWISKLLRQRKKASKSKFKLESFKERGMSPDSCSSGYSTEGSTGWRRPEPTPVRKFTMNSNARTGRGVLGFAVCLSPLVRPSSSKLVGDLGGQSHIRRHVSVGAALVPNGSRKLADHGRFR